MTHIKDSVALVTGGNRGLGLAFVNQLLEKGAKKVYAASRSPQTFNDERIVNIPLDVADPTSIAKLPSLAPDVTIVINNAGIIGESALEGTVDDMRGIFETNVFGPTEVVQALAPALKNNGGGAIVNVLSALSFIPSGLYGGTKAAMWSISNALRQELSPQNTQVVNLHVGYMDTDMVRGVDAPKNNPVDVANTTLDGVEDGLHEVLIDDASTYAKSILSGPVENLHF